MTVARVEQRSVPYELGATGWGAGAESRRPLGLAVVGGLAFSQLVTLYVTPVVYTYLDALQQRLGRGVRRVPITEASPAD